ncbi:Cholesterol 7-alpha-monooxygenase [Branchiostoma belcheri]|nr:Cholesterol 7-alpha-monooxygenase [Branchiostoma belcheri]
MLTVLLCVCFAVVLVIVLLQATTRRRRPGEPPLERGPLPYLGVALEFSQNPLGFITSRWKKYGDVFTVRLAGDYTTFVLDPHSFTHAIRNSKVLDFRLFSSKIAHRAFGMPIVYGTPRDWVRVDSVALYPQELQGQGLDKVTEVMMGNLLSAMFSATDVQQEWNSEELWAFVYRIMFSATFRTLFGRHRENKDETARLVHSMEEFQKYDKRFPEIISNVPWWLMGQTRKRYEYLTSMVSPAELSQRGLSDFMRMRQEIYTDGELSADEKAAFNFATMWASLSNTVPAAFWTLNTVKAAFWTLYHLLHYGSNTVKAAFWTLYHLLHHGSNTVPAAFWTLYHLLHYGSNTVPAAFWTLYHLLHYGSNTVPAAFWTLYHLLHYGSNTVPAAFWTLYHLMHYGSNTVPAAFWTLYHLLHYGSNTVPAAFWTLYHLLHYGSNTVPAAFWTLYHLLHHGSNTVPAAFWTLYHLLHYGSNTVPAAFWTLYHLLHYGSNTLPAAFWTLYHLLKDPVAMAAVRAEVDQLLRETGQTLENVKEGGEMIHVTRQQLNDMKCLGSAINEALRMCSASIIIRVATEDAELALESGSTFRIRKGDRVGLYPGFLHMDPEVYDDPETFKYDRFLENGHEKTAFYKNGRKLRHYLLPFGHGVSMCPGRFFALNEIKQLVTIVVCYFDMELIDMETPPMDQSRAGLGTLAPLNDYAATTAAPAISTAQIQ